MTEPYVPWHRSGAALSSTRLVRVSPGQNGGTVSSVKSEDHLHVHVYVHQDDETRAVLARIEHKLQIAHDTQEQAMADFTNVRREVSETRDVMQSAAALIRNISQQLRDVATDPAAIQDLADQLDSSQQDLAAAIAENTPAAGGGTGEGNTGTPGQPVEGQPGQPPQQPPQ